MNGESLLQYWPIIFTKRHINTQNTAAKPSMTTLNQMRQLQTDIIMTMLIDYVLSRLWAQFTDALGYFPCYLLASAMERVPESWDWHSFYTTSLLSEIADKKLDGYMELQREAAHIHPMLFKTKQPWTNVAFLRGEPANWAYVMLNKNSV